MDAASFEPVVEDLTNKAKHLGLYVVSTTIATDNEDLVGEDADEDMLEKNPDIKAMIESGEASFALMVQFTVGDLAFDTRVQNPTQFETDQEFRRMMPSEHELHRDNLRERIEAAGGEMSDADMLDAMFGDLPGDDFPELGEDDPE